MNNKFNKFISIFLVLVLCFSFVVPSPAAHALAVEAIVGGAFIATVAGAGIALAIANSDGSDSVIHSKLLSNLGNATWQDLADDIAYSNGSLTIGGLAGNIFYNTIHNWLFPTSYNNYSQTTTYVGFNGVYSYPINSPLVSFTDKNGNVYSDANVWKGSDGRFRINYKLNGVLSNTYAPSSYNLSYEFSLPSGYFVIIDTFNVGITLGGNSYFKINSNLGFSSRGSTVSASANNNEIITSDEMYKVANPDGYIISSVPDPSAAYSSFVSSGYDLPSVGSIIVNASQPQPTSQPDEPLNIPDLGYDPDTDNYLLPDGTTVSGQTVRDIVSTYGVNYLLQYLQYMLDRNNPRPTPTPDPNNSQLESNLRKASLALLIGYLARTLTSSNILETTGIPPENYPDIGDIINSPDSLPTTNYYQQQINNYYNTYNSSSNTGFFNWWKQAWQNFRNWLDDLFHIDSDLPEAIDYGSPPSPDISPSPSPTPNPDGSSYHGGWIKGLLSKLGISSIVSHISAPWGIVYEWIQSISGFLSFISNFLTALPRIMVLPFYGSLVMFAVLVFIKKFTG